MRYQIKAYYQTGDSFDNEDTETTLELVNEELEVAKANMKRINDHYQAYKLINGYNRGRNKQWKDYSNEDWYAKHYPEFSIVLITDSGNELRLHCDWCGYFETLYYVELVNDNEFRIYV